MVVVGAAGGGGGGGWVAGGAFGWVDGGVRSVVVVCGRVEGGAAVVGGGDVGGGAVVELCGGTIWARACHMAAAPKAMVTSTTIPAARQRELTPLLFSPPRLIAC